MKLISNLIAENYKVFNKEILIKRALSLMLLIAFGMALKGQSDPNNLEKYWFYRERLKQFVVTDNYAYPGTNIPAHRIEVDAIGWDDGNGALNQYISMLATEYRLLKDYGQDVSQTVRDLCYAINSFERLDRTAESYYGGPSSLINGFFIRDDIKEEFWNRYKPNGTDPYFEQTNLAFEDFNALANPPSESSIDNCLHYLESFTLVEALVDNETVDGFEVDFKEMAKRNVRRIFQNMTFHEPYIWSICGFSACYGISSNWYLANPVTGNLVYEGDGLFNRDGDFDGTLFYASYGFSEAANRILNNVEFSPTTHSGTIFRKGLTLHAEPTEIYLFFDNRFNWLGGHGYVDIEIWAKGDGWDQKFIDIGPNCPTSFSIDTKKHTLTDELIDDYKLRSLCATGNISDANGVSPYDVLIRKQNDSQIFKYEHLPLIWSVINNDYSKISSVDRNSILALLNCAPSCGPNKIKLDNGDIISRNPNWSSTSRLIWPENNNSPDDDFTGEYNGLDYMLLHNLFWLANLPIVENISDYRLGIPWGPEPRAKYNITCSRSLILDGKNIILSAGESIILNPGFEAIGNGTFEANTSGITHDGLPVYYRKLPIDDYPACP